MGRNVTREGPHETKGEERGRYNIREHRHRGCRAKGTPTEQVADLRAAPNGLVEAGVGMEVVSAALGPGGILEMQDPQMPIACLNNSMDGQLLAE